MDRSPRQPRILVLAAQVILLAFLPVPGVTDDYKGALTVIFENDALTGSDNNYTNGLGISWSSNEIGTYSEDSWVRKWANLWSFLPLVGGDDSRTYATWTLGHEIHSPDEIEDPTPPRNDQPYAGILYLDSTIQTRRNRWGHIWSLRLGIVGPSSGAEALQKQFHELIGANQPRAWDTQLPDEPVINLSYTGGYLLAEGNVSSADWRLVPIATASLGNYDTGVGVGSYAEVGWNLPDALAVSSLRNGFSTSLTAGAAPQPGWSVAFYAGVQGYAKAHYLPLDGTVSKDSRSVDSETFLGIVSMGMSVRRNRFAASLGASWSTKTFPGQRQNTEFGVLNFAWYF